MATKRNSNRNTRKESPDVTQLLTLELQEILSAETQLTRVMPRFLKVVESQTLRKLLERRVAEGERVVKDVESALEALEQTPGRKKNIAAEGLINDAREHTQEIEVGPALDAVLIASVQKTEHYCIAAWGTVKSIAQVVGQKGTVKAMERALKEGKAYDEQLTQLAEEEIMPQVLSQSEGGEEGESEDGGEDEDEDAKTEDAPRGRSQRNSGSERRASK